jgi:hypothetical protein
LTTLAAQVAELPVDEQKLFANTIDIRLAQTDFWEFAKYIKTQNENTGQIEPYPVHFDYLHKFDQRIEESRMHLELKSRQMFVSFHMMAKWLWYAWKANKDIGESEFAVVVSKREKDAFYLIKRAKFMYETLPQAFKDYNPMTDSTQSGFTFKHGGRVEGFPASEDIGRTYSMTRLFFDELAFSPHDRQMWAALRPTIGIQGMMHGVTTANGRFNMFYDMWTNREHYTGLSRHFLHWSEHPDRDKVWAEEMKTTMPEDAWEREYEGSFAILAGKRVYPGFSQGTHVREFALEPRNNVIYRTWDFGFHHPAVLFAFKNKRDQLCIYMENMGEDVDTRTYAEDVVELSKAEFPKCSFRDFCDVAGHQAQSIAKRKDARSDIDVLKELGIYPKSKKIGIRQSIDLVKQMLLLRADGEPWLRVHPRCQVLIDGFQGGYCFEEKEGKAREVPKEDGYYEHLHDDLRYKATFLFEELIHRNTKAGTRRSKRSTVDHIADPGFNLGAN